MSPPRRPSGAYGFVAEERSRSVLIPHQEPEQTPAPTARTDRPPAQRVGAPLWLLALGIVVGPAGATGLVQAMRADPTAALGPRLDQIDQRLTAIEGDGRETRRSVRELEGARALDEATRRARDELARSHLRDSRDPSAQRALDALAP